MDVHADALLIGLDRATWLATTHGEILVAEIIVKMKQFLLVGCTIQQQQSQ